MERNFKNIESLGYDVIATDIADDFIKVSKNNGLTTILHYIIYSNLITLIQRNLIVIKKYTEEEKEKNVKDY